MKYSLKGSLWIIACNHSFMWTCTMLRVLQRSISKTTSSVHLRHSETSLLWDLEIFLKAPTQTTIQHINEVNSTLGGSLWRKALLKIQSAYEQPADTFTSTSSCSPPLIHTHAFWQGLWAQEVLWFSPAVCCTLEQVGQRVYATLW